MFKNSSSGQYFSGSQTQVAMGTSGRNKKTMPNRQTHFFKNRAGFF
jgi:hypothetical protein